MKKSTFFYFLIRYIMGYFLSNENVGELQASTPQVITSQTKLYFYVNLEAYNIFQEGIASLNVTNKHTIKAFNAKYVSGLNPDQFLSNMPVDKSDYRYVPTFYPNYSHLYFRRGDAKDKPRLLVYIEFTAAQTGSIVVSSKEKTAEVYSSLQKNRFEIKDYIPTLIKYTFSKEGEMGFYYMFFCDSDNYQTVYTGNLLANKTNDINNVTFFTPLYSYSIPWEAQYNDSFVVTMVYFGPVKTVYSSVKNTYSKTIYLSGERPKDKIFYYDIINTMDPFFVLGSYKTSSKYLIYFERLFGQFQMYYRSSFKGESIEVILPTASDEVKNQFVFSSSNVDLFAARCATPCGFNVHFISSYDNTTLMPGESKVLYLEASTVRGIAIKGSDLFRLQLRNIQNTQGIQIKEFNETFRDFGQISNQTYNLADVAEENKTLCFKSREATIVHVTMKTKNNYINLKEFAKDYLESPYAILEIDNDSTISAYYFTIENDKKDSPINVSYSINYGPLDHLYDLSTGFQFTNLTSGTIEYLNPYHQKYPFTSFLNSKYYILFKIEGDIKPNITLLLKRDIIKSLSKLEKDNTTVVEKDNRFLLDDIPKFGNKQLVFFTTKCANRAVRVKLSYNEKTFKVFYAQKTVTIANFANPFDKISVQFNSKYSKDQFAGLRVYYSYYSLSEVQSLDFNSEYLISSRQAPFKEEKKQGEKEDPNNKNKTVLTLIWSSPFRARVWYNVTYLVYQYHKKQDGEQYDICRNMSNFTLAKNISSNAMDLNLDLIILNNISNYFFIIAQPEQVMRPQFFYSTVLVPEKPTKPPGPSQKTLLWLYIAIGFLGAVCVGLAIGYIFVLKKRRSNIDINAVVTNQPLTD